MCGVLEDKLAAGSPDHVVGRGGLDELKSVAEGVALANQGVNVHLAERQREFEANDLALGNFIAQNGGEPGFAQVDVCTREPCWSCGVNLDADVKGEAGLLAALENVAGGVAFGLIVNVQREISMRRGEGCDDS